MSQVNKYANKAGYTADKNRKDTQSAVSYIEDDGALIYDGVNVVVDKPAAGVGDLAVFDKTTGTIRFVKGATLVAEQLPPQALPGVPASPLTPTRTPSCSASSPGRV